MQNEFFFVAFRKKVYKSIEELQNDLDQWIGWYNTERTRTGKHCYGKIPLQTFEDSILLAKEKLVEYNELKGSFQVSE
ncbi:hypothetical protein D7Z94_00930 [Ulvibacterium marinum]|uniref:Integrase catalytic domain-containing protein n=1 Tax=Ulvibacterium marinum TaxID=2419782 RepID=A0A3B0CEN5_9FLAO|nr:hypothetical protein D7Z94_00930 [Ulvibacterium marinum]